RARIHDHSVFAFAVANQRRRRDLQHVCSGRKLLLDWSGRSALSRRYRRHQPLARLIDDAVNANRRALELDCDYEAATDLLRADVVTSVSDDRRFRLARPAAVLSFL